MMKFVAATTRPYGIKTLVSMNPLMIDGTGMCGGCRVKVGDEYLHACVDGPDFDGHLVDYEDHEFYRKHRFFTFDTIHEHREYQVLSVFRSEAYPEDDTEHFHYYDFTQAKDKADFDTYVKEVTQRSQYVTGVTAEYGDELLTLSTCAYHTEEGRFVVVAKRVK